MPVPYEDLFVITKKKIFDDIFNYSDITLKNNIKLTILNQGKTAQGLVYTNVLSAILPDSTNKYYLFLCSRIPLSNLLSNASTWMNMEDLLNQHKVNIDFITIQNKIIPKYLVYAHIDHSGHVLFAIDSRVYKKFGGTTETYAVINIDTDDVGEKTVISHIPGIHENRDTILIAANMYTDDKWFGIINGYVMRNDVFLSSGTVSDMYELYRDENIKFTFTIDLNNRKTYLSSEESLYKDIIVLPKALTLDKAFTYDTISLVVRDSNGKGVYIPFLPNESVSQLTHASFSVSSFLIDGALDKLGVTSGELVVLVSDYSKNNVHQDNGSVTDQLYLLEDTKIYDALHNDLEPEVPFWIADAMEKRSYGKYLTDIDELEVYNESLIKKQIECLGFYSFVQLLCKQNGEIADLGSEIVNVDIPIPAFWKSTGLYPILYLDGNKIPYNRYEVTQDTDTLHVTFQVPYIVDFPYSILHYELMVKPSPKTVAYTPTTAHHTVSIQKQDGILNIFCRTPEATQGLIEAIYNGYKNISLSDTEYFTYTVIDDTYVFTFKPRSYDSEFILTFDRDTTIDIHPNVDISNGRNLQFIPTVDIIDSIENVPVLISSEYDVYLNGKFMVAGIDYVKNTLFSTDNDEIVGGDIVTIQNLKFIKDTEVNTVEIYKQDKVILSEEIGYIVDGIIPKSIHNEAWINGVSSLYINGKRIPFDKVEQHTTHFTIANGYWSNGNIYQFRNTVSKDFYDAYSDHLDSSYFIGRQDIARYFIKGYNQVLPDPIIISNPNKIYSSYLNEIIYRILNGLIMVNYINNDDDIIDQLRNYETLKRFDALFDQPSKIDKRFVDIFPGYLATVSTDNMNHYLYIKRLVKIVLGQDTITDHSIVYTGT